MNATIPSLFRGAVDDSADATWLRTDERSWTYSEALDQVLRIAGGLRGLGVDMGDRVVVTARNEPRYLFTWLALMEIGAIQVPVNPAGTVTELDGLATQVRPGYVITDGELWPTVSEAVSSTVMVDVDDIQSSEIADSAPADLQPTDPAVMIPTSGTTGRSKLVVQTHRAYVMAGEGFPHWMRLDEDDRLMTALPLFHINAPAYSVLGSVAARAGLVLLPRFSASSFLDAARRHGATQFNSIGAMLEILMRRPARADDADTPLRLCYTGPSPTRERQLEIESRFGLEIVCGYGLSESPYGLIWQRGERPFGTLGSPRQHPTLGHVNDARVTVDGRPAEVGETGELELRNPAVMLGYFEMPDETEAVLRDGWLRTGDLVTVEPDEIFTFVGRVKEVIRRRGENLSPTEVEAALESHADVAEVAVVAVESDLSDEEVKAFVVATADSSVDIDALNDHALQHLARYKVPRFYEVVAELPYTPTGRIAKHLLPRTRSSTEIDMEDRNPLSDPVRTWIGSTAADRITVADRDLPTELMGRLTLTELTYLLITRREPTDAQRMMLDAVLVSLADHGLTPSALSARLTHTGAPEAIQGAVAAGLLGAGSVFLGPAGDTAQFLADAFDSFPDPESLSDEDLSAIAGDAVRARRENGERIPGLGHPIHKDVDPRTPRLYELADEVGTLGPHLRLLRHVATANEQQSGRSLPINGAGAAGAALADIGLPPAVARGVVLIARTAGLVAHLAEEMESPMGRPLFDELERRSSERD